jgi:hypothetical protein
VSERKTNGSYTILSNHHHPKQFNHIGSLGVPSHTVNEKTKAAYRHLLYVALLDMRVSPPTLHWWSPGSLRAGDRELRRLKALANCFHNLAAYSVRDFDDFEEERFWRDVGYVRSEFGDDAVERYRRIFDAYLDGKIFVC